MATYKVLQDLDAEDKVVGPFTFKQLVFLLIAGFLLFFMFLLSKISIFLIAIPLPFFLVFAFFGLYRRKDQSVEAYVAAILRFYFKPRIRIWDKDGVLETVHITAPKAVEGPAIDNRSNDEVKSSLKSLGNLMDTRGWSARNTTLQDSGTTAMAFDQSDRIAAPVQAQQPTEIHQSDDMFGGTGTSAQNIATMSQTMQDQAKQTAIANMQAAQAAPVPQPQPTEDTEPAVGNVKYQPKPTMKQSVVSPIADEGQQAQQDEESESSKRDESKIATKSESKQLDTPVKNTFVADRLADLTHEQNDVEEQSIHDAEEKSSSTMTTDLPAGILNLSNNNDRSIESLAKEADAILSSGDTVSLHDQ